MNANMPFVIYESYKKWSFELEYSFPFQEDSQNVSKKITRTHFTKELEIKMIRTLLPILIQFAS